MKQDTAYEHRQGELREMHSRIGSIVHFGASGIELGLDIGVDGAHVGGEWITRVRRILCGRRPSPDKRGFHSSHCPPRSALNFLTRPALRLCPCRLRMMSLSSMATVAANLIF